MNSLVKRFFLGGLVVKENYAWCLVVVVIFIRLGGVQGGGGARGGGGGGGFKFTHSGLTTLETMD